MVSAPAIWEAWVGAAVTEAEVTEAVAEALLPAVDAPGELTADTASDEKAVASLGIATVATPTTWEMRVTAEAEGRLPMLFWTIAETVLTATCIARPTAGLSRTASASGIGAWGRPPGGVMTMLPAVIE